MTRARDLAVEFLEQEADAKDRRADEVADPIRVLAETDALTEYAGVFRDLPDDHPAVIGLESMLTKAGGDEDAFRKDFARMVRRETSVDIGSDA